MTSTPVGALIATLRARREGMGLSQSEAARRIGVGRTSISNFESGKQDLPTSKLLAYADALGLRLIPVPVELLGDV